MSKRIVLSEDEKSIFINRYPNYTTNELIELFYSNFTKKKIHDLAHRIRKDRSLDLYKTEETEKRAEIQKSKNIKKKLTGRKLSDEHKKKISENKKEYFKTHESYLKGRVVSQEERKEMSERRKGKWDGENNPRHKEPLCGEANGKWKGGSSEVVKAIRNSLTQWKNDSMKKCGYKCILTGEEFDNIHHLYPFVKIIEEAFENLGIGMRRHVSDYDKDEFESLITKISELHKWYGLGVCLSKKVHKLFHNTYGYTDNTAKQFYEFAKKEYGLNLKE
jgi:hypothetical protein